MREFGPSPTPEETTEVEEEEKETQGIAKAHEIAALRSSARSKDDYEALLQKTRELRGLFAIGSESRLSGEVMEQMKEAREIMGKGFMGPKEVKTAFGFEPAPSTIPEIPFDRSELQRAAELGQMLVLRVGKTVDGKPMTMDMIRDLLSDKVKDGGKVLYNTDRYKDEAFFKDEQIEPCWALTSREVIPSSTSKNYLEQTEAIVDYLKSDVFAGKPLPKEYQDAIAQFESQKAEIGILIDSDWKAAAEKLESLSITQMTRQTPAEAIYDLIMAYQNNEERLLSDMYAWTSKRDSDGFLVDVGPFGSVGVLVLGDNPGARHDDLGVSFSRSIQLGYLRLVI